MAYIFPLIFMFYVHDHREIPQIMMKYPAMEGMMILVMDPTILVIILKSLMRLVQKLYTVYINYIIYKIYTRLIFTHLFSFFMFTIIGKSPS
jgi:hypothetical protein